MIGPNAHLRPGTRLRRRRPDRQLRRGEEQRCSGRARRRTTSPTSATPTSARGASFGCGVDRGELRREQKHRTTVGERAFIGCNANLVAPVEIEPRRVRRGRLDDHEGACRADALAVSRARQRNIEGWGKRKRARSEEARTTLQEEPSMCGIVGYVGRGQRRAAGAHRRPAPPRVPRLRLRRRRDLRERRELVIRRAVGKLVESRGAAARRADLRGAARHRPHALGHARQALRAQRASAPRRAASRSSTTASSRTTASCARSSRPRGRAIASDTDTELVAHLIDARLEAGDDLRRGRARGVRARWSARTRSRVVSDEPTRPHRGREERRQPDRARPRREAERSSRSDIPAILPYTRQMLFLEDGEFAVLSRGRRAGARLRRPPDRARAARDPVGSGLRGEGRLRPLHAEGDLRAAARDHATRSARACSRTTRDLDLDGIDLSPERVASIERVTLVACGTAYTRAWSAST